MPKNLFNPKIIRQTTWDILKKSFSTSENVWKSHYEALCIPQTATQNDIKTAYYRLSKLYHPDKNKGSESAADKFRDITAAYEVLGNLKLRKMYDKGILHAPEPSNNKDFNPDMPETYQHEKFYHSRNIPKRKTSNPMKSQIYNFDDWTEAHYGATFTKRAAAKTKYDDLAKNNAANREDIQRHGIFRTFLITIVISYSLFYFTFSQSNDRSTIKNSDLKTSESVEL